MPAIKLRICREEYKVIYHACREAHDTNEARPMRPHMSIEAVLLAEWNRRVERQQFTWHDRQPTRDYAYALPTSTALALQHVLLLVCPNGAGQTLILKLDQALVNLGYDYYPNQNQ